MIIERPIPKSGYVFSSEDYEAGELVTHAQSTLWITGDSMLAKALVAGAKPHNALGATLLGLSYQEFERRFKEKDVVCKDARQAAKPPNFGYPGGLGPVKLVHQQRKQGEDTPHPSGPNMIKDPTDPTGKRLVCGYKGLRFCILMDKADACGTRKITEWQDRKISPTCEHCIKCAQRLKEVWLKQWPENKPYFAFIQQCVEQGQTVTADMLARWPHLVEAGFFAGQRLSPGEIMQHVSGRIRGGVEFCSGANSFFQGLLADITKAALRRISRECLDRTYRVPTQSHALAKVTSYGGAQSPLYGSKAIGFFHDELFFEHPEAIAHDAAMRAAEVMVEEMIYYCPDMGPACRVEPTLMRVWSKQASLTKDATGRLIPWERKSKVCA